jgi:hypothetical protein
MMTGVGDNDEAWDERRKTEGEKPIFKDETGERQLTLYPSQHFTAPGKSKDASSSTDKRLWQSHLGDAMPSVNRLKVYRMHIAASHECPEREAVWEQLPDLLLR